MHILEKHLPAWSHGSERQRQVHLDEYSGCLDRPTTGRYLLEGEDVPRLDKTLVRIRNRRIGFVFQGFNLLARTTALENTESPTLYSRVDKSERQRRALEALKMVGL